MTTSFGFSSIKVSWPANAGHPDGFCTVLVGSQRRHLGGPHSRAVTTLSVSDPALGHRGVMARLLRGAENLPVEADALEPIVQAEQVGETHAAMHFGRGARDERADLRQMRLHMRGEAARLVG